MRLVAVFLSSILEAVDAVPLGAHTHLTDGHRTFSQILQLLLKKHHRHEKCDLRKDCRFWEWDSKDKSCFLKKKKSVAATEAAEKGASTCQKVEKSESFYGFRNVRFSKNI